MKAGELSGPSTSGRGSDDLDLLWSTFCTEARQTLPPPPVNAEFPVGCLPAEMDDDLLAEEDSRLPPPLLGSGQSEAEMQSDYITMLETFVQERQQQQHQPLVEWQNRNEAPPAGWTSEALRLRQENRMLRAKNEGWPSKYADSPSFISRKQLYIEGFHVKRHARNEG